MIKKEQNKAVSTVILMMFATLFAKVLGLFRSVTIASIFAASMEGIAFSAASKIPFAIFDMLFSTAILGSFLPIYRGHVLSDEKRANAFSSSFFTFTTLITTVVALLGVIFSRPLVMLAAPNLDEETLTLAGVLLRIMFPAICFAGMAYTLIGVMQSHEKFLLPAMISAISNLIILAYLIPYSKIENKTLAIYGLAGIYLFSWAAQFLTLMLPLLRSHHMPKFSVKFKDPDLILAKKRALPVMIGAWLVPMTTLIANAFSSYIDANSIEIGAAQGAAIVVFENAFSVFSIAAGLMTYGICNYLFPKLSATFASGDKEGFGTSVRMGLSVSLAVTLPLSASVYLVSDEIIRFLYLRGNFTEALAIASAQSLKMLALAMPAYSIIEFLSRTAYSCGKVLYPMKGTLIGIFAGLLSSLVCFMTNTLSVKTVSFSVVIALSASALTQCFLSRGLLALSFHKTSFKKITLMGIGIALSATVMSMIHRILKKLWQKSDAFENLVIIALVFLLGFVVYLLWIFLFRYHLFSNTTSGKEDISDG